MRMGFGQSLKATAFAASLAFICGGCATGPRTIETVRLPYNESVKITSEEQLLLNIVRLRYGETPSSLAVSSIASQTEFQGDLSLIPFFGVAGGDAQVGGKSRFIPHAGIAGVDRPTVSLTPLDDHDFTRNLFTPLSLDGILYLVKTTWPISTVFRLYLENLNWVANAQFASGPTPKAIPVFREFRRGIDLMQRLQDRGWLVFSAEERTRKLGGPFLPTEITPHAAMAAAKSGLRYILDPKTGSFDLTKRESYPVLFVHPVGVMSPEMKELAKIFHLKPGRSFYDVSIEAKNPFSDSRSSGERTTLDLEPRSPLQALYFVSQGVEVPQEHTELNLVRTTRDSSGNPFDWRSVTDALFRVVWSPEVSRPKQASVAVRFRNGWFYIEETDHVTKATFSLLLELSRMQLHASGPAGLLLTLPN